ncbi:unnamed protein product [Psylliodes chrysocephalus]|uniref:Uncharacterized protein n=1 Tax=Psylliodes chrysocephalus TaxID=3402493 RepID=A0A9P0D2C0_9CUCU|nr:unnamed protein product [Psylliodes chrysocephala]
MILVSTKSKMPPKSNVWKYFNETTVVTDEAANMSKAIDIAFGKKKHLHCFAHQLNLVAEKSRKSVEELGILSSKIKSIVTFFKQSVHASDVLRKAQKEENEHKNLKQEMPTR